MEINKANASQRTIASFLVDKQLNSISNDLSEGVFQAPDKKLEAKESYKKTLDDWSYTISLENHWYGNHVGAIQIKLDIEIPEKSKLENLENWFFIVKDLENQHNSKVPLHLSKDGESLSTASAVIDLGFSRKYQLSLKRIDNSDEQRTFINNDPKDRPRLTLLKLHQPQQRQQVPQLFLSV